MAISPEHKVSNKDTKAKNTQRFELFLYSQIVFRPDIEINISIGKKDQFHSKPGTRNPK